MPSAVGIKNCTLRPSIELTANRNLDLALCHFYVLFNDVHDCTLREDKNTNYYFAAACNI